MRARRILTIRSFRRGLARALRVAAFCGALGGTWGCTAAVSLKATAYDVRVQLDPPTHQLRGQTTVTLQREPAGLLGRGTATVEFALNRALKVNGVAGSGARIQAHTVRELDPAEAGAEPEKSALVLIHRLVLDAVGRECRLTFDYGGELVQDIQAGEKRGQIHNFLAAAHIAGEGIYLDASGGWYPLHYHNPAQDPRGELAAYTLAAEPVAGTQLVVGATFDAAASQRSGKLIWRSKYPLDGLVLVGGPHQIKERQVGPVHLALHYSQPADPESRATIEKNTDLFLAAAAEYLTRYPPLIGPYPYEQFTIVENFFSSGFAFPEFTLLNKVLLQMGPRALGHGYLDHEILHAWWGNGIYVDPADGNWCEALTSYGANYYGYILDGNEKGARDQRRNCCVAVSRLKADEDKPLGTFGRGDGPGRDIGYSKGTMVFHMLARRIGQDNFWAALRRLTAEYTGKYANWQTLQTLFEEQGSKELDRFFKEWVRTGGAPQLRLVSATWRETDRVLEVTLTQGETSFGLTVPLRVMYREGTTSDQQAELITPSATVRLPLERPALLLVLDPDYQVLRRLRPEEIIPSSATTRAGKKLLIVRPPEVCKFYQRVIEDFSEEPGSKEVTRRSPSELGDAELTHQSVLIVGDAVRSGPVQALLTRAHCPIVWHESGFSVDKDAYDKPEQAVLCTVHHPDIPDGGITVYYGNSEAALGRSDLLPFYRDSLVVFETSSREVEGQTVYDSRVIGRRDFESPQVIMVDR